MAPDRWEAQCAPGYKRGMSVRKRPDGRWFFRSVVRFPDGTKKRVFGSPRQLGLPNTKVGATEARTRKIAAILSGQPIKVAVEQPKVKRTTVRQFEPVFIKHSEAKNKESSVDSKKQIFKTHILPALGDRALASIDYAAVEDFKHGLLERVGRKTANNVLTVLRAMLRYAHARKVISEVPRIDWLKVDDSEFRFLSFEEAARLITGADDDDWRPMIVTALRTGMRQGELLGLQWDDIDFAAGKLLVRRAWVRGRLTTPKSGKSREIPLSVEAVAALKAHRHLRGPWVFCTMEGKPLKKSECKWPLWRAAKRAGMPRLGWHVLRHTFASHLVMRNVPLKAVQELLGHATIEMTMRYAHLSPDVKRDAVNLLDFGATPVPDGARERRTGDDSA